jgi:general secretion pathway protein A
MFLNHYQLHEDPFGVAPDPRYTYFTSTHREALASLAYAVEIASGFAVLVAKPGMGKTTLLFRLLDYLQGKARTVFIFHTQCNSVDLMRYILADMKIKYSGKDLVEMHALLHEVLLSEARVGRTVVVAIDESQNLSHEVLETVRLLSNFETPRRKLLQIILCGQPQLGHKLAHPDLVQLRQRVTILCRLAPLTVQEVSAYIDHRLQVAGHRGGNLFTPEAVLLIARESRGIPRIINTLCSSSLSIGCALERSRISPEMVQEVLADLSVDSIIAEMAGEQAMPTMISPDFGDPSESMINPRMRKTQLAQETATLLEVSAAKPGMEEQNESASHGVFDIASEPSMLPAPTQSATAVASPVKPAAPVGVGEFSPSAPGGVPIPRIASPMKPRAPSKIGDASEQSYPIAEWALKALRGKSGWLVGTIFLAPSLLGLALRFGVPRAPASGKPAIIPDAAFTRSLSGPAISSASGNSNSTMDDSSRSRRALTERQHSSQPVNAASVVHVVRNNETLSGISFDYLGRYDDNVLQEVQKNNADLKDPNVIHVGQKVLLPERVATSGDQNSAENRTSGSVEGKP